MEYSVSTSFGRFRIKENDSMISVSAKNWCVQVVYKGQQGVTSELSLLETGKGRCELSDKQMTDKDTVNMVYLAINLLRRKYPHLQKIHLIDTSTCRCRLPDKSERHLSMMKSQFLFHGKTYYESRFGAVPRSDTTAVMDAYRKGWTDPSKKPPLFDFNNPELSEVLTPLYMESSNWAEFMRKIQERWGVHKCSIIYPWYLYALNEINSAEMPTFWTIDISSVPNIDITMPGGKRGRKTHKRMIHLIPTELFWDRTDIYILPYRQYLIDLDHTVHFQS